MNGNNHRSTLEHQKFANEINEVFFSLILTFGSCWFPPNTPIFGKIILISHSVFLSLFSQFSNCLFGMDWTGTGLVIKGYYFSRGGKLERWPKMQHSVSALLCDWDIASKLGEAEFVITWSFISFCKNRQYLWRVRTPQVPELNTRFWLKDCPEYALHYWLFCYKYDEFNIYI